VVSAKVKIALESCFFYPVFTGVTLLAQGLFLHSGTCAQF